MDVCCCRGVELKGLGAWGCVVIDMRGCGVLLLGVCLCVGIGVCVYVCVGECVEEPF